MFFKKLVLVLASISISTCHMASQGWKWVFPEKRLELAEKVEEMRNVEGDTVIAWVYDCGYCKILRSPDGGKSWETIVSEKVSSNMPTPNPFKPSCACLLSTNAVYVAFDETGTIKRFYRDPTRQDTFHIRTNGYIRILRMADTLTGVATDYDSIYITRDGWRTRKAVDVDGYLSDVFLFSDLRIGAIIAHAVDENYFYQTPIDSIAWSRTQVPNSLDVCEFINDTIGWARGWRLAGIGNLCDHIIYKTTNGGTDWKVQLDTFTMQYGLQDIKFKDDKNGIAVGQFNVVYRTSDGGDTWVHSAMPPVENNAPTMTACYTKDAVLVGTFLGNIYRSTFDGGPVSVVTRVSDGNSPTSFAVDDEITLEISSDRDRYYIITSLTGQVVSSGYTFGRINVSRLVPGVYTLRYAGSVYLFTKN